MQAFNVYYVDYAKRQRRPIGVVYERRKKDRPDNIMGLLKLARKIYSLDPEEAFRIVLEKNVLQGLESGN